MGGKLDRGEFRRNVIRGEIGLQINRNGIVISEMTIIKQQLEVLTVQLESPLNNDEIQAIKEQIKQLTNKIGNASEQGDDISQKMAATGKKLGIGD